ncbi:MAG: ribose 5-phosphate isomerase B [Phycisphaerales bacterium]|nr:ribose 5-phosphate isomerase B [Phycisphaerales bacterium]
MKIALGADHRGIEARIHLAELLVRLGHEVTVCTECNNNRSCDYPDVAYPVALAVVEGRSHRGILICGTGIGMSIAANKIDGVRAALCHDEIAAEVSRRHNDANVLCLSGDMLGLRVMDRIVQTWLRTEFEGGRHARRLQKSPPSSKAKTP